MKFSTLQRLGGSAIVLGAALLTAWAACWTTQLPVHERARDLSLMILDPDWIWVSALSLPGTILMIFGFTAVYATVYGSAGIPGFLGYLFIIIAYLLQTAKITWEIFVYPVIVENASSVALFREKILPRSPQVVFFRTLAELTIFLGVLLFCTTLIRSREFPKSAGILIFGGAVIYAVGPMINIYLAILGVGILSAGCCILGARLFSLGTSDHVSSAVKTATTVS